MNDTPNTLHKDVSRRRTFAIISHPDAGKTTLTEKLLLYGDAIHLAGAVKRRRGERHTTSDWMEVERQRGISVSTSVLQFAYRGYQLICSIPRDTMISVRTPTGLWPRRTPRSC